MEFFIDDPGRGKRWEIRRDRSYKKSLGLGQLKCLRLKIGKMKKLGQVLMEDCNSQIQIEFTGSIVAIFHDIPWLVRAD